MPQTPLEHRAIEAAVPVPHAGQFVQVGPHRIGLLRVSSQTPPALQNAKPLGQQRPSVADPGRTRHARLGQQFVPELQALYALTVRLNRRQCLCAPIVTAGSYALSACETGLRGPIVARSRYLTVYGQAPTQNDLDAADRFIEQTAMRLRVAPPASVDYYLAPPEMIGSGCTGYGVTDPVSRGIYAAEFPHYHEIVHAVSLSVGLPPLFFVEGLAEALTPLPDFICVTNGQYVPNVDIEWLDTRALRGAYHPGSSRIGFELYAGAGVFTRLMLREFGYERYLRFYRTVSYFADLIEVRRAFVGFMGITIERAIEMTRRADVGALRQVP